MISSLIDQFVYRPDATMAPADLTPADLSLAYEDVTLQTSDGVTLWAWYLPAPQSKQVLLYCHGNAGDIRDWVQAAPPFVAAGCSLLIFDYRGYGRSQGRPSEEGLYRDGEAAWAWLQTRAAAEGLPATMLGKSLGSAVAVHAAAHNAPAALILDSAFTSMRQVVAANAPWVPQAMIPELYESIDKVPQLTCPTLVIHGERDTLVPVEHARHIYRALPGPKALRVIEGAGHNDVAATPEYHHAITAYLNDPLAFTEEASMS